MCVLKGKFVYTVIKKNDKKANRRHIRFNKSNFCKLDKIYHNIYRQLLRAHQRPFLKINVAQYQQQKHEEVVVSLTRRKRTSNVDVDMVKLSVRNRENAGADFVCLATFAF